MSQNLHFSKTKQKTWYHESHYSQSYRYYLKMVLMSLTAEQQWRHRHREHLWTQLQGGGRRWMDEESNMETYITVCKTASQWELAV